MSSKNRIAGMSLPEIRSLLEEQKKGLPYGYRLPYMQWYEENFIGSSGVREMSNVSEWIYRQLLAKAWVSKNAPYLPNDKETLKNLSGCKDGKMWSKHSPDVLRMFDKTESGDELFHTRQLVDYAIQICKIVSNIENGRKNVNSFKNKEDTEAVATQPLHGRPADSTRSLSQIELEREQEPKQEGETEMKADKQIAVLSQQAFGKSRTRLYGRNQEELNLLILAHKGSAVVRAFSEWVEDNEDDPDVSDALAAFLRVSDSYLNSEPRAVKVAEDPAVNTLVGELAYVSDNVIGFDDRAKVRLSKTLENYPQEEILSVFREWFGTLDLSNPKDVSFGGKNFSEKADQFLYSARKKKQEADQVRIIRDATARKLQDEAEAERLAAAQKEKEADFDPFS